jgi:DNA replication and repair protein RecF
VAEQQARFAELVQVLGEASPAGMGYEQASGLGDGALDADLWRRELERTLERDARRGMTTEGPHRDELRLTLAGREIRTYGSAGQQRTAAIALRVLEAECLARARGQAPIALFDDIFAELDASRQRRLLALIQSVLPGQAIVAAPREEEVPAALFDRPRWQIAGGRIVR